MNTVLAVLGVIVAAVIVIALSIWLGKSRKRDLDRAMGKVAPTTRRPATPRPPPTLGWPPKPRKLRLRLPPSRPSQPNRPKPSLRQPRRPNPNRQLRPSPSPNLPPSPLPPNLKPRIGRLSTDPTQGKTCQVRQPVRQGPVRHPRQRQSLRGRLGRRRRHTAACRRRCGCFRPTGR